MYSCEYCEIFKSTYFEEHLLLAASGSFLLEERYKITGKNGDRKIIYGQIVDNVEDASVDLSVGGWGKLKNIHLKILE